jgi:GTP-binding protein
MEVKNAKYELTAVRPEQYPATGLPEIALLGRSNVGKSSFINTLLNRKNLARVGGTPGKTRELNFYNIDEKLYLVDLPGYGFAGVAKAKKLEWGDFVEAYLNVRPQLRMLVMLVDIRHTPSDDDILMHDWLKCGSAPYIVVANKVDKISRSQIAPRIVDIRNTLGINPNAEIIAFSSVSRQGKEGVWKEIDTIINETQDQGERI